MADAGRPSFTIREIRPAEFEALGELTVRAYADLLSPSDADYLDELRDVGVACRRRAGPRRGRWRRPCPRWRGVRAGTRDAAVRGRARRRGGLPDARGRPGGRGSRDRSCADRGLRHPRPGRGSDGDDALHAADDDGRAPAVRIARLPARPGTRLGIPAGRVDSGRTRSGSSRVRDGARAWRRRAAAGRDRRAAPAGRGRARGRC